VIIRLNFLDFWEGFDKTSNYFYKLLSQKYELIISDDPELIFYSCFGKDYLNYKCIRIFYTGENIRPDFTGCDFAFSFDYLYKNQHYRLPLYKIYFNSLFSHSGNHKKVDELIIHSRSLKKIEAAWSKKKKFCCIVVSNPVSKKRLDFFIKLSKYKQVDSGGRTLNNIGGPVEDKMSFIQDYRFVISFENESYPGYTTEKIIEPMFVDSIPIYWGNPLVGQDFNKKRFLDYSDFDSEDELISRIIELDENPKLAIAMLSEPVFPDNKIPECIKDENIIKFLDYIISEKDSIIPVAMSFKRYIHSIKRIFNRGKSIFKFGRYELKLLFGIGYK
jgi:alpha(1,3/1,4) fucosyltransferase